MSRVVRSYGCTSGAAPGKLNTTEGRSCFELGVCQGRKPACSGCSWQLAPGVVDGPYQRLRSLGTRRFFKVVGWLAAASAVGGFIAGMAYQLGLL